MKEFFESQWGDILLVVVIFILILALIIQRFRMNSLLKKERQDAVKRSRAVLGGQMIEQVAPFLPDFPCNPADVRFIGKPVDFIGFSGLAENDCVDEVLLIEVKTGDSKLSGREKEIKNAVKNGRVRYVEYKF
ncbi:MAG: hypothetical protein MJ179_04550 [Treponema sp.]|nr:hypothetical protein [Treponema sp.]